VLGFGTRGIHPRGRSTSGSTGSISLCYWPASKNKGDRFPVDRLHHRLKQTKSLHFVLDEWIALSISPKSDPLLNLVEIAQMLGPMGIDKLQERYTLQGSIDRMPFRSKGVSDRDHCP
jgi:hypothetical protein